MNRIQTAMHSPLANPLLMSLLTHTDKTITPEARQARLARAWKAIELTKNRTASFQDWEVIAQVVNYVLGFIKQYMPGDEELVEQQKVAARSIYAMSQRTPIHMTEEELASVNLVIEYYGDILEVVTERELAGIELYINHECEAAKVKRMLNEHQRSRRSSRKPKKKVKK